MSTMERPPYIYHRASALCLPSSVHLISTVERPPYIYHQTSASRFPLSTASAFQRTLPSIQPASQRLPYLQAQHLPYLRAQGLPYLQAQHLPSLQAQRPPPSRASISPTRRRSPDGRVYLHQRFTVVKIRFTLKCSQPASHINRIDSKIKI